MSVHVFHIDTPDCDDAPHSAGRSIDRLARPRIASGEHELCGHAARGTHIRHVHPGSEDTIYVIDGAETIEDLTNDVELTFEGLLCGYFPVGVWHAVKPTGDGGSRVLVARRRRTGP